MARQWHERPYSKRNLREYAENYDADPIRAGQLRLVAEFIKGEVFGLVDLYDISPTGRTAFVGIYIMEPHRNRGRAIKVLRLIEDYARRLLNLRIIAAKISETNVASVAMFESAGYVRQGDLTDWLLSGTDTHSLYIYTKRL